jgi:transposase
MGFPLDFGVRVCAMRAGKSLSVSSADIRRLKTLVRDRNAPQKHVWRAEIVLLTADGVGTNEIMRRTGKSKTCVWRWQERFIQAGFDGLLRDKTRPSRIPPLSAGAAERVVALTLGEPPSETTHWTGVLMAKAAGLSVSSVQRIWRKHGLQPHRMRQFKLSNDPRFVDKLRDVVGLYVDPPAHAIVLSVDEKSQIQALDRTQPGLPLKKGRAGTMTHDYERHGTTTLFAAMNVLDGTVIGRNMQRHRHSGVHPLPQCRRKTGSCGEDDPRHHRQLRRPQASQCPPMARTQSAMDFPLHADVRFLAQRGRGLLRNPHEATAQARRLPVRHRPASRDQPLPRRAQ